MNINDLCNIKPVRELTSLEKLTCVYEDFRRDVAADVDLDNANMGEEVVDEWSTTSKGIGAHMRKLGYKQLGSGVDQTAYVAPDGKSVLKIFGTRYDSVGGELTVDQEMFQKWADYCLAHKGNRYLPRFSGWTSFEFEGQNYLQIRMELLGKVDRATGEALENMAMFIEKGHPLELMYRLALGEQDKKFDGFNRLVMHIGKNGVKKLWDTVFDIWRIGNRNGWELDLHMKNYMMRSDGSPVILDPWVT